MSVGERVRDCDKFGAKVQLKHKNEDYRGTFCGGFVSMLLRGLIIAYFSMRSIDVIIYQQP